MAFQGAQMGRTICLYKTALNAISSESFSFKCEDHLLAGSEEEEHEKSFCLLAMEESQQQSDDADSTAAERQRFSSAAIQARLNEQIPI